MKDFGELGVLSSIQLPLSDGVVSHHELGLCGRVG